MSGATTGAKAGGRFQASAKTAKSPQQQGETSENMDVKGPIDKVEMGEKRGKKRDRRPRKSRTRSKAAGQKPEQDEVGGEGREVADSL
jgi:hypothetical protein